MYRVFDYLGWSELIYNHITVKLPGEEGRFLINPYGLHYKEVTASNLVVVDISGAVIGESAYPVNPAGMLIHSAIHAIREDAHCIAHTHTTAGMAVACQEAGLRNDNFYSVLLQRRVAYHDFEGITVADDEKPRLCANLGTSNFLILRNHGLLTCGQTIPATFANMWLLQRACEIQMATDSTGRANISLDPAIGRKTEELTRKQSVGAARGELEFAALVRIVEKLDPSFKD